MYPNLYYAFRDLFGVEWKFLRFVNTFGFFVAIAFLCAAFTLSLELKRKERQGLLLPEDQKIIIGKPASLLGILINLIFGFLLLLFRELIKGKVFVPPRVVTKFLPPRTH